MQRSDLKQEDFLHLVRRIIPVLMEKGLKSTTMDSVASILGMSKRTLYEIFGSKDEMIKVCITEMGRANKEFADRTFTETSNVMEAFIKVFRHNRDNMQRMNVEFFRDLDMYKDRRETYEKTRAGHDAMQQVFERGVREGLFRSDLDFPIQSRIMAIQMESLKRMEEFFPADISLLRVFDAIILGFLRSIASPKGMMVLDELTSRLHLASSGNNEEITK